MEEISQETAKSFADRVSDVAQSAFKERFVSSYLMGSLARGGFSAIASDIDCGIIIKSPLSNADQDIIGSISKEIEKYKGDLTIHVSIFWGSIRSINGEEDGGRYPPFDRFDLISHAKLIAGDDVRQFLHTPTQKELEIASMAFALRRFAKEGGIDDFKKPSRILKKGVVEITKTVLWPVRFIYILRTGKIAGNDVSVKYFRDNFSGHVVGLVSEAYKWRSVRLPPDKEVLELLENSLVPLYEICINIYVKRLEEYGEKDLVEEINLWLNKITSQKA